MTTAKEPGKKAKSGTDWARIQRQRQGLEPIDTSEMQELSEAWFKTAEISYPGQITFKTNIDKDIVEWFQKHWTKFKQRMNQVLRAYKDKKMEPLAQPRIIKQVQVVGKFDHELVEWLKGSGPDYEWRMNLMLRDFMNWCIEKGEPK